MSEDDETIAPIAGWMAALRGPALTPTQLQSIKEFMANTPSQAEAEEFADAYDICESLKKAAPGLFETPSVVTRTSGTTRGGREVRELENKITPVAKRAAIEAYRPFRQAVLEHIRRHGAPTNMSKFIREMRTAGALARVYAKGASSDRSDRTIRNWLRDEFGLQGKPGRPKTPHT